MDDNEYGYVKKRINDLLDIDLDNYKERQMRRRLTSFLERANPPDIGTFFNKVEREENMLQELKDFLTINVSEFFRDEHQFQKLETTILPELFEGRMKIKLWSAGCSIGAEPYTLAIMMEEIKPGLSHTIVATDLDETILKQARAGGPYSSQDVRNVKPDRLSKYFKNEDGKYWVVDKIRDKVKFKRHNLLSDQYEDNCDLILCRNVVIYFTDAAKSKINRGFHDALREGGILFIGGSEIIFDAAQIGFGVAMPSFYRRVPDGTLSKSARKSFQN